MKKFIEHITLPRLATILIGAFIVWYIPYHIGLTFPLIGRDAKYYFPRLIDTHLFYHINGFRTQWFSPSFGGGLPAYPHPQNMQFSIAQFLTLLIDPWSAYTLSFAIYVLVGYLAGYRFLRRSLDLHWSASTLGAALFSASGFYLEHMANGQFNFQAFPLLPVFLVATLDPSLSIPAASAMIGLTTAVLIYSVGGYPILSIILALLISLPLSYLIRPKVFRWKHMAQVLLFGGVLALTINISKLYAVNSFMRFFPRDMADHFNIPLQTAPIGLLLQLVGVMGLAPLYTLLGIKLISIRSLLQDYTGAYLGLWELDLSMSPVLWVLLIGGVIGLGKRFYTQRLAAFPRQKAFWLALILLLLAVEFALEATFARGWIYPQVRTLPLLKALHINPRFGSAFIFPLATIGAVIFSSWIKNWPEKRAWFAFLPANLLVLLSLGAYQIIPYTLLEQRNFDITGLLAVYQRINRGETFPIENVGDVTDQTVFERQTTNTQPYESLFGYTMKYFQPTIVNGPAREIRDGAFNMTDPTGLVYPEVNGSSTWSRIPQSEASELEDFLAHRQPDWKIPLGQQVSDWVSLLSLFANLGLLAYGLRGKQTMAPAQISR